MEKHTHPGYGDMLIRSITILIAVSVLLSVQHQHAVRVARHNAGQMAGSLFIERITPTDNGYVHHIEIVQRSERTTVLERQCRFGEPNYQWIRYVRGLRPGPAGLPSEMSPSVLRRK
jgi:hypothetical protein